MTFWWAWLGSHEKLRHLSFLHKNKRKQEFALGDLPLVWFTSACACFTLSLLYSTSATHSTSTSAFLGSVFTATAERAGKGALKNSE